MGAFPGYRPVGTVQCHLQEERPAGHLRNDRHKPREADPLYTVNVQFKRFRSVQYSRELSDKVWHDCVKIAEQSMAIALKRLFLDEKREPLHVLARGSERESRTSG